MGNAMGTCRDVAGVKAEVKAIRLEQQQRTRRGMACAIRLVLERAETPLTANEIAERLKRKFRQFAVVSMVERLDERCVITSVRQGGLCGCWVYTLHAKVEGLKAAGALPVIQVWPVPDLRATLEDLDDDGH